MKTKTRHFFYSMGLALLFGSGVPTVQAEETGNYPPQGDPARGARAWADNCTRCHNLREAPELRDDQWITTTFHMRVRAGLTGQETRDIITFLQMSN